MTRVINKGGTRYTGGFSCKAAETLQPRMGRRESMIGGQSDTPDVGRRRRMGPCAEKPTIRIQAGEMILCRRLVRDLLEAPSRHREQPFRK